jgi:very-short-patch-repair endonuclease
VITALARARKLRKNPTDAERFLWRYLRLRQIEGYRFRRQRPIGRYIVDFVCLERKIVIEVDGGQHNEETAYDAERDRWLQADGYRVLRFWNHEILTETKAVMEVIQKILTEPPPSSSPARGGGKIHKSR